MELIKHKLFRTNARLQYYFEMCPEQPIEIEEKHFDIFIKLNEKDFFQYYFELTNEEMDKYIFAYNWAHGTDQCRCIANSSKGKRCKCYSAIANQMYIYWTHPKEVVNPLVYDRLFYCKYHCP